MRLSPALRLLLVLLSLLAPSAGGAQTAPAAQTVPDAQAAPGSPAYDSLQQADAAFHAGYAALQAGNLEQARIQFAQAASLAPQIPEGHEALGEVLIELGRPVEAVPELEAALQLKPSDQEIETNLAMAYEKAGDPVKAIPQFKAAF